MSIVLFVSLLQVTQFATIEGMVVKMGTAEPLAGAWVTLTRPGLREDPQHITTDTNGRFTFTNVVPGRCVLYATHNGYTRQYYGSASSRTAATQILIAPGQVMKDVVFRMMPTATIAGRVYDASGVPVNGVQVKLLKATYDAEGRKTLRTVGEAQTNDLGEYRLFWLTPGAYYVRAEIGRGGLSQANPNEVVGSLIQGYLPTYYPGTADPAGAALMNLTAGVELLASDIRLISAPTYKITGRLLSSDPIDQARIGIAQENSNSVSTAHSTLHADGTFEVRNVAPGSYTVQAVGVIGGMLGGHAGAVVEVTNADVNDVLLDQRPRFDIPGRYLIDEPPAVPKSAANRFAGFRITLSSRGRTHASSASNTNGNFIWTRVMPGSYRASVTWLPPDSYLKAMRLGSIDLLRDGLTLESAPDGPIEVVISMKGARVEGTLVDRSGAAVSTAPVALVPHERERTERYKLATTDPGGLFTFTGIAPGSYKLFAWEELEGAAYRNADFLRPFEDQGRVVSFAAGESVKVELRLPAQINR